MPCFTGMRVDETGFEITADGGLTFTRTAAQIKALYQSFGGSPSSRVAATVAQIKADMLAVFGIERFNPDGVKVTFDPSTGAPIVVEFDDLT